MMTIKIYNVTEGSSEETEINADYRYSVFVNDEMIAVGTVSGHNRSDGWPALLELIAKSRQ